MSGQWSHGKGDRPRKRQVSREEYDKRWAVAMGLMPVEQFDQWLQETRKCQPSAKNNFGSCNG